MAKRQDRFVWKENDVTMYDKDGNKIDPKTGKPVKGDDPYSAELKKLLIEEQKRKRKANG